jgi:hypothetical protein
VRDSLDAGEREHRAVKYVRTTGDSLAAFWRSRVKMLHVSKTFRWVTLVPGEPATLFWDKGITFNVGRNAQKRARRADLRSESLVNQGEMK